jgi:hypothetical protein
VVLLNYTRSILSSVVCNGDLGSVDGLDLEGERDLEGDLEGERVLEGERDLRVDSEGDRDLDVDLDEELDDELDDDLDEDREESLEEERDEDLDRLLFLVEDLRGSETLLRAFLRLFGERERPSRRAGERSARRAGSLRERPLRGDALRAVRVLRASTGDLDLSSLEERTLRASARRAVSVLRASTGDLSSLEERSLRGDDRCVMRASTGSSLAGKGAKSSGLIPVLYALK